MSKRALITGITGQDGSYLAEFLLEQGYEVFGLVRRTSTINFSRLENVQDQITLVGGDMLDQTSLEETLRIAQPDEVYNLAAQSFVGTSWRQPTLTGDVTALGVTRLLDAMRHVSPNAKFYQASSSEMFGKVREVPQTENTPFYPRSPYGVAKVYGHWMTVNYRESYGMFAASGMLFNHECVTAETPVIIRKNGIIDILPIEDVIPHRTNPKHYSKYTTVLKPDVQFEVWDANGWTKVTCMTATWNGFKKKPNKVVHRIAARGAVYHATSDHVVFACEDGKPVERPAGTIENGHQLALINLPLSTDIISITEDEAWLLGILAAEGSIKEDNYGLQFTNQSIDLVEQVADCWYRVCGGASSRAIYPSGFENGKEVIQLRLTGGGAYRQYLFESLYTRSGDKRIPMRILNASQEAQLSFLRGYNAGDGLKSTPCTYEFQGFKTSSAVMAAGLYWLATMTLKQRAIICLEERNDRLYYQINLNSPDVVGQKGQHLRRPLDEVVKAEPITYENWVFDLATESGTFHAGIGQGWIHNSPRRGIEFVTRKITWNVARIKHGIADKLYLGNPDSQRDWGFAGDYVRAMWLMLQQAEPEDYVISTGETHSIREFAELAFGHVGLNPDQYVVWNDPRYTRPAEVDLLIGNPAKAGEKLGWETSVTFQELVEMMVESDMKAVVETPHHQHNMINTL